MELKKILLGSFSWKRLFTSLVLIYVIMNVYIHFISDRMMFPYDRTSYDLNLPNLSFIVADNKYKIATRFWKSKDEKNLILFFHGNYLDLGYLDDFAEKLNSNGYSVFAMDYRGYGLSQGTATDKTTYKDSQLLYDTALKMGYSSDQLLIVGRSIGTGVATELALKNNCKALILISPFVSAYRVMTNIPLLPFDKFNNLAKISQISEPLFIIHGTKDIVIKPWHSELIIKKHKGKKQRYLVDGAGHNDILDYEFENVIQQFQLFIDAI